MSLRSQSSAFERDHSMTVGPACARCTLAPSHRSCLGALSLCVLPRSCRQQQCRTGCRRFWSSCNFCWSIKSFVGFVDRASDRYRCWCTQASIIGHRNRSARRALGVDLQDSSRDRLAHVVMLELPARASWIAREANQVFLVHSSARRSNAGSTGRIRPDCRFPALRTPCQYSASSSYDDLEFITSPAFTMHFVSRMSWVASRQIVLR